MAGRHAAHLAAVPAESRRRQRAGHLVEELARLEAEHADLRAAYLHLAERDPDRAAALAWDLWLFLVLHYLLRELEPARRELAATAGDDPEVAALTGLVAVFVGDVEAADGVLGAAAEPPPFVRGLLRAVAGQRALLAGDLDAADAALAEAEATGRAQDDPFTVALTLNMRATVSERRGDLPATAERLGESVALATTGRLGWPLMYALPALAGVAVRLGEPGTAAALFGAAAALTGSPTVHGMVPVSREDAVEDVAAVRAELGSEAFDAAVEESRQLGLEGVAALAARLRTLARG